MKFWHHGKFQDGFAMLPIFPVTDKVVWASFQNEMIGERAVQLSVLELITSANQNSGQYHKKPVKTERR